MAQITPACLILASGSPRRRELLARIGIRVEVMPAEIDETPLEGEDAVGYARRLAAAKAAAVSAKHPTRWVLAADTVVEIGGRILGKAGDAGEARSMLASLLGGEHRVTTAFCLCGPGGPDGPGAAGAADAPALVQHATTVVVMRGASAAELDDYIAAGEWRGKAGAYAVQGMAAALVREVRGSVTNVIGLPLAEVAQGLSAAGAAAPRYCAGEPA